MINWIADMRNGLVISLFLWLFMFSLATFLI